LSAVKYILELVADPSTRGVTDCADRVELDAYTGVGGLSMCDGRAELEADADAGGVIGNEDGMKLLVDLRTNAAGCEDEDSDGEERGSEEKIERKGS
jgi:hypothetical protein